VINESASTIARRIASVPARTSTETWQAIIELLAEAGSAAHRELTDVTSIAGILISEEYTRESPIVIKPVSGSRIRVYTIHGMAAIEAINDETPLYGGRLNEPGWSVSLPCGPDDLDEAAAALADTAAITVRDTSKGLTAEGLTASSSADVTTGATSATPAINLNELRRP
jgi:hypothetical protein